MLGFGVALEFLLLLMKLAGHIPIGVPEILFVCRVQGGTPQVMLVGYTPH